MTLDPLTAEWMAPRDWPSTPEARLRACGVAEQWLGRWARRLAEIKGISSQVDLALARDDVEAAIKATGAYGWYPEDKDTEAAYLTRMALSHATNDIVRDALTRCGLSRISHGWERQQVHGLRLHDLAAYLLQETLIFRVTPMTEAFLVQWRPLAGERREWSPMRRRQVEQVIQTIASTLAGPLLAHVDAPSAQRDIVMAWHGGSPVVVDIPIKPR